MKSNRLALFICLASAWMLSQSPAKGQDAAPATQPAGVTGTWAWIQNGTFGTSGTPVGRGQPATQPGALHRNSHTVTLTVIQTGEKLTGQVVNYGPGPREIQEATFKDGQITFQIIQVLNPQTATRIRRPEREVLATYKGKLDGDVIRGTTWRGPEGTGGGETWVATRQPEQK